ncbi:MAG TPA: DNA polymerase III subunit gamma/tau [Ignavibacteriaceae bacterium]|nr:DNA polymerase III subunit gamma/tau [Ignavibacteriaceae bacterium]
MAFIVTARKWRPQKFNDVVGQEHITTTLKNAIKNNRIAHAYLFTGPRGVGKTTTARILAKTLNCTNPVDFEACGECEMCQNIQNGQTLDIIEIDGASNRGIDEIKNLRESVKFAPARGKYKVYIIDEVHMLTRESFNAFLKTLEEPPSHTIFIFATTDIHKVPLTIISRCQRYDFRRIQLDTIKELLNKIAIAENIQIDDTSLTIIAKKADGALRDAESYFDQVVAFCGDKIDHHTIAKMLNLVDDEIYFDISDAVINKNFKVVFEVSKKIYENGWNFVDFVDGLTEHFRNIMTVILTQNSDLIEAAQIYKTRYLNYIDQFSEGDLLRLLNYLNKVNQELKYSQNQKLKVEISLAHMIGLERSSTISSLLSKISEGDVEIQVTAEKKTPYLINSSNFTSKLDIEPSVEDKTTEKKPAATTAPEVKIMASTLKAEKPLSAKQPVITFDEIKSKWDNFANYIAEDNGLILGPFMKSLKLASLEGNNVNVVTEIENAQQTFNMNKKLLNTKISEFFKVPLNLNPKFIQAPSKPENKSQNKLDKNDPYVKIITDELGGKLV